MLLMSLDAQNPKRIQIKVTSISTESKSIFKLMHSYHFLKANNGNILQIQRNISWLSWCPLDIHHQVVTRKVPPLWSPPLLTLPSLLQAKGQNSIGICPTWGERETKPVPEHWTPWPQAWGRARPLPYPNTTLLCQQHRGALTLPLSRDPGQLPMGQLGFKILQNIQELIELSNNKCLFFSEASFNTHEENPLNKKLVFTCHLWKPSSFFSLKSSFYFWFASFCLRHSPHSFCVFPASHSPQASCFLPTGSPLWLSTHVPLSPFHHRLSQSRSMSNNSRTCQAVNRAHVGLGWGQTPSSRRSSSHTQVSLLLPHFPRPWYSETSTQERTRRAAQTLLFRVNVHVTQMTPVVQDGVSGKRKECHVAPACSVRILCIRQTGLRSRKSDSPTPQETHILIHQRNSFVHFPPPLPLSKAVGGPTRIGMSAPAMTAGHRPYRLS